MGNCDIDFLNFCHCQVQNFKISKLWTKLKFCSHLLKVPKVKPKVTKYFETSWKPSVILLKCCEMLLVSWNLINYCKILQFLIKFCKSLKDLRNFLLKWLIKTVKYCLNFVNFNSCTEKWPKVDQLLSITLMKVYSIPWRFSWS